MVGGLTRIQDGMRSWSGQRERERERELFIREGNRARVTKAERERECFIQGQFGTGGERERVWHVIFI